MDQHLVVGALSCIACGKGDRGCELQRLPQNRNMDRLESKSTMKYHKMRKSGHHFSCDRFSPSPHEDDPFFSFVSFKRTENESHFQHANDKSKQSTLLCVCVFVSQG